MGRIKDLMIDVMCFADELSKVQQDKLFLYKNYRNNLITTKYLNKIEKSYEISLVKEITEYMREYEYKEEKNYNKIVDLVMGHNSWDQLPNF